MWRDDHTFLTCGRDGYIIQHVFRDAKRPADHVNLSGVDFSINGDIGHAYSDKRGTNLIICRINYFINMLYSNQSSQLFDILLLSHPLLDKFL